MKSHQRWSGDVQTLYHIMCGGINILSNRTEWTAEPLWRTKRPIKWDGNMEIKMSISECKINKRPLFVQPLERVGISRCILIGQRTSCWRTTTTATTTTTTTTITLYCISIGQRTKFNWGVAAAAATATGNFRLYLLLLLLSSSLSSSSSSSSGSPY
jgi:hypothetical protein